jgi:hypothetical protein
MRRVSMATRNELVEAIAARYARSDRAEKARILDEFVAVTNFHRKHVMRLLRDGYPFTSSPLTHSPKKGLGDMRVALAGRF